MGNSINSMRPGHVPMCLEAAGHPGLASSWDPDRVTHSIFAPQRIIVEPEDGGASEPVEEPERQWRPTEEILADMKSSDAWKEFMGQFEETKPEMEAGKHALSEVEEGENDFAGLEELKNQQVDKEKLKNYLHILKEKTGLPYTFCKKAMEKNDYDLEKAEKWMEEESKALGIEKLKKVDERKTLEGLVGIAWEKHYAAMVEVNSETDFVSMNSQFHILVDLVARTCLQHTKEKTPKPEALSQVMLKGDEIGNLIAEDKLSLSDHLAKAIALLGERLRLRRAALISTEESAQLAVLTHKSAHSDYDYQGKVGAVLVYKTEVKNKNTPELTKQLCQHIIAASPKSLEKTEGVYPDEALLTQPFIHNPSQTVADVALKANLKIEHFVRFERGETSDDPNDLGTQPAKPLC